MSDQLIVDRVVENVVKTLRARDKSGQRRGKRRDEDALEFVCGAAAAVNAALGEPHPASRKLTIMAFLVAARGADAIKEFERKPVSA